MKSLPRSFTSLTKDVVWSKANYESVKTISLFLNHVISSMSISVSNEMFVFFPLVVFPLLCSGMSSIFLKLRLILTVLVGIKEMESL
jgi:hypothetical protein